MDLRRLRVGEVVAGLAAIVVLVSLFLPWYEDDAGEGVSGWEAFAVLDVILALLALSAIALVVLTVTQETVAVPLATNALMAPIAVVVFLLVLFRLANLPLDDGARALGVWLGTLATLALTAGTWVALRDERLSTPGHSTDLTGRPAPQPRIDPLPPPNPSGPGA